MTLSPMIPLRSPLRSPGLSRSQAFRDWSRAKASPRRRMNSEAYLSWIFKGFKGLGFRGLGARGLGFRASGFGGFRGLGVWGLGFR